MIYDPYKDEFVDIIKPEEFDPKNYCCIEDLIKHLDKNIDPKSIRQISSGIRVGLPIICTGFIMRFLIPSLIAAFSGKVMDIQRENRLNVKV